MITSILDLSHYEQGADILAAHRADDCAAVIAQCTYGASWVDPTAQGFITTAIAAGIPCGEYHYGNGDGHGAAQADHFRKHRNPRSRGILDFEWDHSAHGAMSILNAERFVSRLQDQDNETPILYTSVAFVGVRIAPTSPLASCRLWVPAYGNGPPHVPHPFPAWTLWQYTDGRYGPSDTTKYPRITKGLGRHCDRSAFVGTLEQLADLFSRA